MTRGRLTLGVFAACWIAGAFIHLKGLPGEVAIAALCVLMAAVIWVPWLLGAAVEWVARGRSDGNSNSA